MKTYAACFNYAVNNNPDRVSTDTDHYPLGNNHLYYNRNTFEFRLILAKTGKIVTFRPDDTTTTERFNPNGCVLYSGPSAWDGEPIVVVLTGLTEVSENSKTDDMLQTWILRADRKPTIARQDGSDCSVCGDCPHRAGSCYVNLGQGPRAVYDCLFGGSGYMVYTPYIHDAFIQGRRVRIGSYGDPAMVPVVTFERILRLSAGHTGYTHQWDKPIGADLRLICMASVDTEAQAYDAQGKGWRYFAVTPDCNGPAGAHLCPASKEGGERTTCNKCGLCMGAAKPTVPNVFIPVHGNKAQKSIYRNKTVLAIEEG